MVALTNHNTSRLVRCFDSDHESERRLQVYLAHVHNAYHVTHKPRTNVNLVGPTTRSGQ